MTMADGMNRVTLLGNLGADPELRYTQGGQPVLNMRMACTESWFDKTANERKERTEWLNVVIWGKRAEGLSKILKKGSQALIEGRLQTSQYDDREGNKRYKTDVVALNVLLTSRSGGNGGGGRQASPPPDDFDGGGGGYGNNDDEIPY
jgi:single-strand DNA-binding protein